MYNATSPKKPEGVICFCFVSHTVAGRLLDMTDTGMITVQKSLTYLETFWTLCGEIDKKVKNCFNWHQEPMS
jgi:hypothetical protein